MTDTTKFDLIVIGAGPGGYACAIRAAQLGLKTACVDRRPELGGTCLNVGCIPSKALLHASHHFDHIETGALADLGIKVGEVVLDLDAMMTRKDQTVASLTKGIEFLFRKNGVVRLTGEACVKGKGLLEIDGRPFEARSIVFATGSVPAPFLSVAVDNDAGVIVDSTGALAFRRVPARLIVVGGGVIGLELGSVWKRLGSKVIVLEYLDEILPGMDADVRRKMRQLLTKQGLDIRTSARVMQIDRVADAARVTVQSDGETDVLDADAVLVCTGRVPNTASLGLDAIGLSLDDRGFVPVDEAWKTQVEGFYAIGDVTRGPMLAHRAEDEGIALAERLAGIPRDVNPLVVPAVVYTHPEAASVGLTEEQAAKRDRAYKVSSFSMSANSRAKANHETDGFVKLIADAETDVVIGAHIVASTAGTMIAQMAQAMEFNATSEDIAYTSHAHPTHNEAVKEAALGIRGRPIHA